MQIITKAKHYIKVSISRTSIFIYKIWLSVKSPGIKSFYNRPGNRSKTIAVVMCTWKRTELIKMTLEALDKQSVQKGQTIELYIWNNNIRKTKQLINDINDFTPTGSLSSVKLHNSPINIGGFGRFYMARVIQPSFPYIIFIDDDQILSTNFINGAQKMQNTHTIASQWAFKMKTGYWDREEVSGNQPADYCGTCGMMLDSTIFLDDELFSCPLKYWFVEDLWLSAFAQHKGWKLRKLVVDVKFIEDGKNQYLGLVDKKAKFYTYLQSRFVKTSS